MINRKFYQKKSTPKIQRKKKSGILYILAFGLLLMVLVALPFALLKFALFNIQQVEVVLDQVRCTSSEQITDLLKLNGQNILFLDSDQIKDKVNKAFLCTKDVRVHKKYPSVVSLNITARLPKVNIVAFDLQEASFSAVLHTLIEKTASSSATSSATVDLNRLTNSTNTKSLLVDEEGLIFATPDSEQVQRLFYEDPSLTVGKSIDQIKIKHISEIFAKLPELNVSIEEAMLFANDIMYIKSQEIILLDLNQDITSQLASLQLILEKAKIENEELKLIDLRFDKPVIRYGKR